MKERDSRYWTFWRILFVSLGTIAFFAIAFISWQYWLIKGGVFRTSSFDATEWKSLKVGTADSSCYRGGMVRDIQRNVLRVGLTREEVEQLLGAPDASRDSIHEYVLGMCSGWRIDFDTLDVRFDSTGRLLTTQVTQH